MYHENLSPEQEAETTAWWRQAFPGLEALISVTAEGDAADPGGHLRGSLDVEQPSQSEPRRTVTRQWDEQ